MTIVEAGARLHFGFQNLSLAYQRLYGGVGVALTEPRIVLEAGRADDVDCTWEALEPHVRKAVEVLDVPGAHVVVRERFQRHVGLGSGTQFALSCLRAIAGAYGRTVDVRQRAPDLGRGGRSGVGVAAFERGGFVVDAGHPTTRFTTTPPDPGAWEVPRPITTVDLPDDWRFVLVTPAVEAGRSGDAEERSMRSVIENADAGIADEIAGVLTRRLLPAAVEHDLESFGSAVARLGRLNGAWYADEQGGVYRPPAGRLVDALAACPAVGGAGQSSWGPTVYGVTDSDSLEEAAAAGRAALDDAGVDGQLRVVSPRNTGAVVGG
jgi:beta-ribofuranosylaminobenzene 5'-phosphate synthase